MIDRIAVRQLWQLVDQARSAPEATWSPSWQKPFENLRQNFERAAASNGDEAWSDFRIQARRFRAILQNDLPKCWRCYGTLTALTDFVDEYLGVATDGNLENATLDLHSQPSATDAPNAELQRRLDEALKALELERLERLKEKDRTIEALEQAMRALGEARRITNVLSNIKFFADNRLSVSARAGDINAIKKGADGLAKWIKLAVDLLSNQRIRQQLAEALTRLIFATKAFFATVRTMVGSKWKSSRQIEAIERLEPTFDAWPATVAERSSNQPQTTVVSQSRQLDSEREVDPDLFGAVDMVPPGDF